MKKARQKKKKIPISIAALSFIILFKIILIISTNADNSIINPLLACEHKTNIAIEKAFFSSYGLFDDISNLMWERISKRYKETSIYKYPSDPLRNIEDEQKWLNENLIPNFSCPHVERVGKGEGVKYICYPDRIVRTKEEVERKNRFDKVGDKGEADCLVYSIGCAGDFSFEYALAERYDKQCEIHVFDPANWERKEDVEKKKIHYHAWGIKSSYDLESKSVVWPKGRRGGFKTFEETLDLLGHHNRTVDLFKIDCEGCEWSTYRDWLKFGFRQILMETHGVPQPQGGNGRWYQKPMDVTQFYKDFEEHGYALFSTDQNGLGMEMSYIKLDNEVL